jgi:hypothetical protein
MYNIMAANEDAPVPLATFRPGDHGWAELLAALGLGGQGAGAPEADGFIADVLAFVHAVHKQRASTCTLLMSCRA